MSVSLSLSSSQISASSFSYVDLHIYSRLNSKQLTALATLTVLDEQFKKFESSRVAAAIVFVARRNLKFLTVWTDGLVFLTKYDSSSLADLVVLIDIAFTALGSVEKAVKSLGTLFSLSPLLFRPNLFL